MKVRPIVPAFVANFLLGHKECQRYLGTLRSKAEATNSVQFEKPIFNSVCTVFRTHLYNENAERETGEQKVKATE